MTKFKELHVGDAFDFISDDRMMNSFYDRCIKTSSRTYRSIDNPNGPMRVGSIHCKVYHVEITKEPAK